MMSKVAQRYASKSGSHRILSVAHRPAAKALSTTGVSPPTDQSPPNVPSGTPDPGDKPAAGKVVVFGGNGFVGSNVCQAALKLGAEVVSVNRSGAPAGKKWTEDVRWVRGDIFHPDNYSSELKGSTGVISCVGGFGSNEHMEKLCGDATVVATEAAAKAGVEHFVFISAAGSQHEHMLLKGYWKGKQKAEAAVLQRFPVTGVILRAPGIYGTRQVGPVTLPLGIFMQPAEMLLNMSPFAALRKAGPLEPVLTPPISVETVGKVAAGGSLGMIPPGVLLVDEINCLGKSL